MVARLENMLSNGIIRRIGAVPNHYRLGLRSNGMSVWNIPDRQVSELGRRVGALEFVTHCYQRPRHLPDWPYNLFCMIHGRDRNGVAALIEEATEEAGLTGLRHAVLFSRRRFKQRGARYVMPVSESTAPAEAAV